MLSLIDQAEMEPNPPKLLNNNSQEAVELLGLSSSDSLDSPSFSQFQAPKQKRKVRFKKPFRPSSRLKAARNSSSKNCNCHFVEFAKIFSYFSLLAIVASLLWYVMTLSTRIQELQDKFSDIEAGNRNTPEALHVIHSKLKQLDSNVSMLYIEVRKNIADIDNITSEIKNLKDVTSNLKESIAAAPAIQQLPKDVHSLSESVASFGSKINALESTIKEIKDQQSSMQTTAQNLYGELDSVKVTMQELTNSTDIQSKSSVNTSVKDVKMQSTMQETTQLVHYLESQLSTVVNSVNELNVTFNNQLRELPTKVETVNDAIAWIVNDTHNQNSRVSTLENYIYGNLTLRCEQLENDRDHSLKLSNASNLEEYVNKTVSDSVLHIINTGLFHGHSPRNQNNTMQVLEETHDILVLLAALLRKFEKIPKSYILSNKNATELVTNMLQQAFEEKMLPRDLKMEVLQEEVKNLTMCFQLKGDENHMNEDHLDTDDLVTPLYVQTSQKQESIVNS